MTQVPAPSDRTSLRTLAALFLRLGATSFGGPAVHIALMRDEVVRRRGWLTDARFLDLLGATNLIPGPNSTEMAIHIGWERRRWSGLAVAGTCFMLPATLVAAACGWAYVRYRTVPAADWLLYGVKPAVLAVVAQAIWSLLPVAAKTLRLWGLGAATVAASALGVHAIVVLLLAGALELAAARGGARGSAAGALCVVAPLVPAAAAFGAAGAATLGTLFVVFLKAGALLFGSGYVLIAFLRSDLVHGLGWLTEAELVDAIAIGQVMPGPISTTATFIGWVLLGPAGALVATIGMFLPAFVFVAASAPFVARLRASAAAASFLDGVNVGAVALMVVVTVQLADAALVDLASVAIAVVALLLAVRWRLNSAWLVIGGAFTGCVVRAAAQVF